MSCIRVFPELETIFIHMAKTGGHTIREYLLSVSEKQEKFWGYIPDQFKHFERFTVVRNPFDRFISSWACCVREKWYPEMASLAKFLYYALDNAYPPFHLSEGNTYSPYLSKGTTRERKTTLIKHHTAPLTTPQFCLNEADQVYRFENYPQVIESLSNRFGFENTGMKLNQSKREDICNYYDDHLVDLVREYFAKDFEVLGYDLNLPHCFFHHI